MATEVTGTSGGACHSNTAWTERTEQAKGLLPQGKRGHYLGSLGGTQLQAEGHCQGGTGAPPGGSQGDTFPSGSHFPPQAASQRCPQERGWALRLPPPPFCHPSPCHSGAQLLPAHHHAEGSQLLLEPSGPRPRCGSSGPHSLHGPSCELGITL